MSAEAKKEIAPSPDAHQKKNVDIDEHLMPIEDICARYEVSVDAKKPAASKGLSTQQAKDLLKLHGPNIMTPPKEIPLVLQYLIALSNMFNMLLIVSGVLCYIVYAIDPIGASSNLYVGAVLLGVAIINAAIEFGQELSAKATLKSFMDLVPRKCMAVRDGSLSSIQACELVPGDLVVLRMGDKMPADCVLFSSTDFKVDNSSLTGEADPQERKAGNTQENPLEATNLAFNGTLAVNGEAYGIVIRTGDHTVLGQIANMAGSEQKRDSPLSQEIASFVHKIAALASVVAIVFFIAGILKNGNWALNINFAIGVFVSFVPEGLPATVTMLLSVAAKRMARRNVLVKDLRGVETLGAITCLATDKTGTLTRNQMTVTNVWSGQKFYDALSNTSAKESNPKEADDKHLQPQQHYPMYNYEVSELSEMALICYLCSKARFARSDIPIKQRTVIGDATESGLFQFAANAIPNSDKVRDDFPKAFEIPFNSSNKWHLSIHEKPHADGHYTLYIKGAPERVFRLCSSVVTEGNKVTSLTDGHKAQFQAAYETMASKGHRVIGCAKLLLPASKYPNGFVFKKEESEIVDAVASGMSGIYPQSDYTFMGLISLEDPPKHGVREAIGQCRQAGIKVMMVTGDHPLTAEAIARKINLMVQDTKEMLAKRTNRAVSTIQEHEYHAIVIHGEMIDKLTDQDWENILEKEEIIFARTSPKHKLQIVKRCQARGHIVGVTGDGVNDSPALKKADLGIAMNISGSDVSKEAAAMILLDDNFASTVSGITEGRLIFQNLKKSIRYTLSHTIPQVLANLLYLVVPLPLPLDPLHIIFCDLGFEFLISLAYAWEPPESGRDELMKMLPRKPVSARSIDLLRRVNKAEAAKKDEIRKIVYGDKSVDVESEQTSPTILDKLKMAYGKTLYFFRHLFDKKAWSLAMESKDEEVLVDANLLSYSYLEVGVIETVACLTAYFFAWQFNAQLGPGAVRDVALKASESQSLSVPNEEYEKNTAYAQSTYYFALLIVQAFNHFVCKCTFGFPFGKTVMINKFTWIGIMAGVAFASLIVYAPNGLIPFHTMPISPLMWLIPLGFGVVILVYGTLRILYMRSRKPVNLNLQLPLDLHPTRWSTRSAN